MMEEKIVFEQQDVEQHKLHAILSYFGLLVLVPILGAKDSPFAKYHANQGLLLLIAGIASNVVRFIPYVGGIVGGILGLVILVFAILGIISASKGEAREVPVIGKYVLYK